MNRLLIGLALLVTAGWLARADDKAAAGPEKISRIRLDWSRPFAVVAPGGPPEQALDIQRFDVPSYFPQSGLLGHVFEDRPPSTGERSGLDGGDLKFVPAEK